MSNGRLVVKELVGSLLLLQVLHLDATHKVQVYLGLAEKLWTERSGQWGGWGGNPGISQLMKKIARDTNGPAILTAPNHAVVTSDRSCSSLRLLLLAVYQVIGGARRRTLIEREILTVTAEIRPLYESNAVQSAVCIWGNVDAR